MAEIPVKGPTAKQALNTATPQAGDIVSKLQRYLIGKGLSSKKAGRLLADAIDEYVEEESASSADEADEIIEQLRDAGVQGKSPEEIADALAEMIDSGNGGNAERLENFLRERVDARLAESESG